jgi:hypothetical protein
VKWKTEVVAGALSFPVFSVIKREVYTQWLVLVKHQYGN